MRARSRSVAAIAVIAALVGVFVVRPSTSGPDRAAAAPSSETLCLPDNRAASLDTLLDSEHAGVVGADYQRAFALPDGRVFWTFQDAAIRLGPDEITIVHNIAMIQDGPCFDVL